MNGRRKPKPQRASTPKRTIMSCFALCLLPSCICIPFWDSLRAFEKELGHDVDGLEGLLGEAWPIEKPQCLNDLRALLERIRNHSAAIGETAKEARS
jgi:hypothetical protein